MQWKREAYHVGSVCVGGSLQLLIHWTPAGRMYQMTDKGSVSWMLSNFIFTCSKTKKHHRQHWFYILIILVLFVNPVDATTAPYLQLGSGLPPHSTQVQLRGLAIKGSSATRTEVSYCPEPKHITCETGPVFTSSEALESCIRLLNPNPT